MRRNNEWHTLIDWTPFKGLSPYGWNRLKLLAQENTFSFFLNGTLLARFMDYTFRGGQLVLYVKTFEEPGFVVRFDNLLVREDPETRALADRANALSKKAFQARDLKEAEEYFQRALEIYARLRWRKKEAACHRELGNCWHLAGDFPQAIQHYHAALSLYRYLGNPWGEAESLIGLGDCHRILDDYRNAIEFYKEALEISRDLKAQWGKRNPLEVELACFSFFDTSGDKIYGYGTMRILDPWSREADILDALGTCYHALGDYRKAIEFHLQAMPIRHQVLSWQEEADGLKDLGTDYAYLGDYKRAIEFLEQALTIYRDIENPLGKAETLIGLGASYAYLGDYKRAKEYYQEGLKVLQDYQLKVLQTIIPIPTEILWRLHADLGASYRALGNLARAAQEWKQAVEVIEWMRGRLTRVKFRASFMQRRFTVYQRLVPTLVELGAPEEGVFYAERAKARTLVDMMETAMVREPALVPATIQTASKAIRQLSAAAVQAEFPLRSGERSGLGRAAQRAREELEAFLDRLSRTNPVLSDTLSVDPDRISSYMEAVQSELQGDEVVLEYFVAGDETILFVITRDGIQTTSRIEISRTDLLAKVRAFRDELNEPPKVGEEAIREIRARKLGKELYDLLIAPVEPYIQTASHLVIVPSDVLFYLPFGALVRCPDCETGHDLLGGEYLIQRYSISYAPSLASLYWPFRHRGDGVYESALSVGNPTGDLKHAEEEARAIARMFPESDLLLGDEGTKERVLELLGEKRYDVIHLSTHGEFNRELPLASGVLFAGKKPLYAGEIMGLRLGKEAEGKWQGCELVVLSACQTGLPPEVTEELVVGDELQGLSQALFVAGTPSAILTLWNVNDVSTKKLMVEMYKELQNGVPKGEALRKAQLKLLQDEIILYHHPYFWAPFVLYGVWR